MRLSIVLVKETDNIILRGKKSKIVFRSFSILLFATGLVEDVGEMASAAVLAIEMSSHENSGPALFVGTLPTKTGDLAILVDLVVFEDGKLDLLRLGLEFLGSGESLLLTFLAATSEAEDKMQSGLFLDVVVGESAAIFKLLAGEDQPLLIWRNSFLVLNLGFDVLDTIAGFDLESDGLTREGFHENLHFKDLLSLNLNKLKLLNYKLPH